MVFTIPETMEAIRLHTPGVEGLRHETINTPSPQPGEALVQVHAAAITRDELDWPTDRLPAIPSYELSGEVVAVADDVDSISLGEAVYGLIPFDRDGAAASYAAVPTSILAPKPASVDHVQSAAIPLPALSAWQGLFDYGDLQAGERLLIHGAVGGVGQFATQLGHWRGAYVIATASPHRLDAARDLGADEAIDRRSGRIEGTVAPVDLVFDTVGGEVLSRAHELIKKDGRIVSVAAEPPGDGTYFVVEANREQLIELARLVDAGRLRVAIDSTFALSEPAAAFQRSLAAAKRGKVVIRVADQAESS
jgi:NADPH:quinone reductase-like Zn-dependent oxidoreductase